jgi:SAM-dependent methyltransferase
MINHDERPCPACANSKPTGYGQKNGFEILVCGTCQTIYTDRLPAAAEVENYDDYYTETNLSVPEFINRRVEEIIGGLAKFRRTNRLLDIGFGSGNILQAAAKLGWGVYGQEVSRPAIEHAEKLGFEVFHGELFDAAYPDSHFDIVTASEIVEHLTDPEIVLKEIARILRPGGMFWATTPFARSLSFRILGVNWSILSPPEHVQLYSKKGMRQILKSAGFSRIKLKTFGLNPMEIFNHFLSGKESGAHFNRVETGYELNESLSKSPTRLLVKRILNQVLNLTQLGDSMKIYAER